MNILQIDEKWAVRFDPENNDRPMEWLRNGNNQCEFDENNAVAAMFYALKEANAALTQSRAEVAAGIEASAILIAFHSGPIPFREEIARKIRAIATPDQTAALDKLIAEAVKPYVEALAWYGEQARLARLIHSEGDAGRNALQADGGKRANALLAASKKGGV